ncbi:MAG: hypothetical protein HYX47_19305 [Burkholderiales bacterium]|nr:hypothetical protein [Burkholderiales bacterium]
MRRNPFIGWCLAALVLCTLAGCSTVTSTFDKVMAAVGIKGTRLAWKEVLITASDGANLNTPVAVDVVMVLEDASLEKLAALPASKWFQTRSDMLKTFPGTYIYKSWEVSPGQTLRLPGSAFGSPSVVGVFVFADYLTPGDHRMRVEQLQNGIIIELAARGFSVLPYKAE